MSVSNFELDITSRVAAGDRGGEGQAALVWQPTLTLWRPDVTLGEITDAAAALSDPALVQCAAQEREAIAAAVPAPLLRRDHISTQRNFDPQDKRHRRTIWRGDSSLPRALSAYAVLQSVIAIGAARASWEESASYPVVAIFAILIVLLLGGGWFFLRTVWRATGGDWAQQGSAFLCGLARGVALVLLLAELQFAVLTGAPRLIELKNIADGVIPTGNYRLTLVRGGTELAIDGPIGIGLSKKVAQVLQRNPLVQALQLNSDGGSGREARKLRDLITQRQLATTTSHGCHGECTLAYIAGEPRRLGDQANLMFHRSAQPGMPAWALWREHEADLRDWRARGVPLYFAEQALAPHESSGWTPSRSELVAAHIVSPSLARFERPDGYSGQLSLTVLDRELRRAPIFTLIEEREPIGYRRLIGDVYAGLKSSANPESFEQRIYPMAKALSYQRLAHAENALVLDYAEMILEQISSLYSESAQVCNRYFGMETGAALDTAKYFSEEMLVNESAIMAEVLRSSAKREYQPPAKSTIQARWNMLMALIAKRYGSNAVLFFETGPANRDADQTCHVLYEFYKAAIRLPAAEAGPVLRYHFAQLQARSLPKNSPANVPKQLTSLSPGGATARLTH